METNKKTTFGQTNSRTERQSHEVTQLLQITDSVHISFYQINWLHLVHIFVKMLLLKEFPVFVFMSRVNTRVDLICHYCKQCRIKLQIRPLLWGVYFYTYVIFLHHAFGLTFYIREYQVFYHVYRSLSEKRNTYASDSFAASYRGKLLLCQMSI